MVTGKEIHTQRNRFFMAFLEKSRKECVKMGLAHEKTSYLQEKANLFEIGSLELEIYDLLLSYCAGTREASVRK